MAPPEPSFGPWLKQRRKALDLTQEALAALVGCAGETIRRFEAGRLRPSRELAARIAACLKLAPDQQTAFVEAARRAHTTDAGNPSGRVRTLDPTAGSAQPSRPPAPLTPLIGRQAEIAAIREILGGADIRLLTLVGAPGIGKTRLAMQVAADLHGQFADGVTFVTLAPISDPDLVVSTIAQALGVKETTGRPLVDSLNEYLCDKQALLVLDNFEQVVDAAPRVAELLQASAGLKALVTSRAPLHIYGEHEYAAPPLTLPPSRAPLGIEQLAAYDAVRLFVVRAQSVKPDFTLTAANASDVAGICRRLDGVPLAIELAAARIKLFSPAALLHQLAAPLAVLVDGPRDMPARQQGLRAAIAWSYNLLTPDEQRLFALLGVFVGGATVEAAAAVDAGAPVGSAQTGPMIERLAQLADKSLLWRREERDGSPRFLMLEMIREYALDQLAASGDRAGSGVPAAVSASARAAHAAYYLHLADEVVLSAAHTKVWLDRMEAEHDNLRAALAWFLERGDMEAGARLATLLVSFWLVRGHLSEGRRWLDAVLTGSANLPVAVRARALGGAGLLAQEQYDYPRAQAHMEESLHLMRDLGDRPGIALALSRLARLLRSQGVHGPAEAMFDESLALFRENGDMENVGWSLAFYGQELLLQGDLRRAAALLRESATLFQDMNNTYGQAWSQTQLGHIAHFQGEYARADQMLSESSALFAELGAIRGVAFVEMQRGWAAVDLGDSGRAENLLEDSLRVFEELGDEGGISWSFVHLGRIALEHGDDAEAAALLERSLQWFQKTGHREGSAQALAHLGELARARGNLDAAAALFLESLAVFHETGDKLGLAVCLERLAGVAAAQGRAERAARLFGAAVDLRAKTGAVHAPGRRAAYARDIAAAQEQLGHARFAAAWTEGQATDLEQTIAAALAPAGPPAASRPATAGAHPDGLTDREIEILRRLAQGLTYSQIAAALIISPHTVNAHLRTIYGKLGVTSRHAATRHAIERRLI